MKKYLYICSLFEQTLQESSAYNELNLLDVNRGGENFDSSNVINVLSNHVADGGKVKPLSVEYCADCNNFIKQVLNCVMMFSNLLDDELKLFNKKLKGLVTFKLDPLNYSKQKFVLEIINAIIQAKYNCNLFVISENV